MELFNGDILAPRSAAPSSTPSSPSIPVFSSNRVQIWCDGAFNEHVKACASAAVAISPTLELFSGVAEKNLSDSTEVIEAIAVRDACSLSMQLGLKKVMERRRWLIVAIFVCLLAGSTGRELRVKQKLDLPIYNHTLARILVEYASAVYLSNLTELLMWTCSRCNDLTKGFEVIELIVDVQNCLQAFVGVAKDLDAIVIAFRGTKERSIMNWIEDLYWKQLDLNYPGISDAMVHHGFYYAYHNTTMRPEVLSSIQKAKKLYGELNIIVTGHSMGGAMAAFCGLDLRVNCKEQNVQVMTFGEPRIGNAAFASYYSEFVPNTFRITHEHDVVPHLPPYYSYFPQKTYHHFPTEVWLHNIGYGSLVLMVETVCDSSGEDPDCSRSVRGNSLSDHLTYFGVDMGCDTTEFCRMVMDSRVSMYSTQDRNGNFILSNIPSSGLQSNTNSSSLASF